MPLVLALSLLLSQPPAAEPATRAAEAAERAAAAAERAALAAERIAAASAGAPPAPAPPEAPPAPVAVQKWLGSAGVSLISLSGNASSLTAASSASLQREWSAWLLGLTTFGTYGQTRPPNSDEARQVVALAAGGQLRGDRDVNEQVTVFLLSGVETNHVKSLELRGYVESGSGITWVNQKEGELQRTLLRTDLAIRYSKESQFQYYPVPLDLEDREIAGPRVGAAFRFSPRKGLLFTQDAEVIANLLGESRFLVNTTSKVSSMLTDALSLAVAFLVNYDSAPAPGRISTDTALTVGIEAAL